MNNPESLRRQPKHGLCRDCSDPGSGGYRARLAVGPGCGIIRCRDTRSSWEG